MSRNTPLLAAAALLVSLAAAQAAEPLRLTDSQLDQVTAGAVTGILVRASAYGDYATERTTARSNSVEINTPKGGLSVSVSIGKGFGLAVNGGTGGSATPYASGDQTIVQSHVVNAHGGPINVTVATGVAIAVSHP
jgi:hypothetical protein